MTVKSKGIDVSAWNGYIDFSRVKKSGIEFVIIRCGGSDSGFYTDSKFRANYTNAKKAGLQVGAYYFVGYNFYQSSFAKDSINHCLKIIDGYKFDLPIFVDVEVTENKHRDSVTENTISFCKALEKNGFKSGVYSSSVSGYEGLLDYSQLKNITNIWVAQWSTDPPKNIPKYMMWQYSSVGKVDGIDGCVDLDYLYISKSEKEIVENKKKQLAQLHKNYNKKYERIAKEVIDGKYKNGNERKKLILKLGRDYKYVQAIVNIMLE